MSNDRRLVDSADLASVDPRDDKLRDLERMVAEHEVTKQATKKLHSLLKTAPLKSEMMPQ